MRPPGAQAGDCYMGASKDPKTPSIQIAPTLGSKVYKWYLLWAIWSLRDRMGVWGYNPLNYGMYMFKQTSIHLYIHTYIYIYTHIQSYLVAFLVFIKRRVCLGE